MKKKIICLVLAFVMALSLIPAAVAADADATRSAQALYELGLFRGTGTRSDGLPLFDLDKTPTRNQAVIMLVRLLGKEEEALAGDWDLPFTDVPAGSTSYPYIGYAYANGLTNGTTATTYSGSNPIRANQFITFVLRSMGYVSGEDFQVSTAWELSDSLGITDGRYNPHTATDFSRGDVAAICVDALETELKDGSETLAQKLMDEEVFTAAQYTDAMGTAAPPAAPQPAPYNGTAFGSEELHKFLMSMEPDEVILKNDGCFDLYVYNGQFLEAQLRQVISGMYGSFSVQENCTQLKGTVMIGTRVECINNAPYGCHINIHTFTYDNKLYETTFGMRMDDGAPLD